MSAEKLLYLVYEHDRLDGDTPVWMYELTPHSMDGETQLYQGTMFYFSADIEQLNGPISVVMTRVNGKAAFTDGDKPTFEERERFVWNLDDLHCQMEYRGYRYHVISADLHEMGDMELWRVPVAWPNDGNHSHRNPFPPIDENTEYHIMTWIDEPVIYEHIYNWGMVMKIAAKDVPVGSYLDIDTIRYFKYWLGEDAVDGNILVRQVK